MLESLRAAKPRLLCILHASVTGLHGLGEHRTTGAHTAAAGVATGAAVATERRAGNHSSTRGRVVRRALEIFSLHAPLVIPVVE
jgi:hypothetical protein